MSTLDAISGVIRSDELYTLEALKKRLGIRDATLRSARRAGLPVFYKHGRGFIQGRDWIAYVCSSIGGPATEQTSGSLTHFSEGD